jgi:type IV fimbrial biogenesis protein FimT
MKIHQRAFTLIEVLTVLAIVSILSMIAIPGLQSMLQRNQDDVIRADLLRLIYMARTEAILLGRTVTLCKSGDSHACNGDWSDGQIAYVESIQQGGEVQDDQILAVNKVVKRHGVLHARFFPFYRDKIHFNPVIKTVNDNGTFWYCRYHSLQPSWALKINRMGHAHTLLPDKNGEIKDQRGRALQC